MTPATAKAAMSSQYRVGLCGARAGHVGYDRSPIASATLPLSLSPTPGYVSFGPVVTVGHERARSHIID